MLLRPLALIITGLGLLASPRLASQVSELQAEHVEDKRSMQAASGEDGLDDLILKIRTCPAAELTGWLQKGFQVFPSEAEAFRGKRAQRLAKAMHERAQQPWSAATLAIISTRVGDSALATRVLREAIDREQNPNAKRDLLQDLGIAMMGAGELTGAKGPLGSAYARGSSNAGVVLGRIALEQGRKPQARAIFRTLLDESPPPSWALRGWGLSLLPDVPPAAPKTSPRTPVTSPF